MIREKDFAENDAFAIKIREIILPLDNARATAFCSNLHNWLRHWNARDQIPIVIRSRIHRQAGSLIESLRVSSWKFLRFSQHFVVTLCYIAFFDRTWHHDVNEFSGNIRKNVDREQSLIQRQKIQVLWCCWCLIARQVLVSCAFFTEEPLMNPGTSLFTFTSASSREEDN